MKLIENPDVQALEEEKQAGNELSEAKQQLEEQLTEAEKQVADTSGTLRTVSPIFLFTNLQELEL